jgi:antirestriction protein ArdC
MKADIYERVTAQIVTSLEQGVKPWMRPWGNDQADRLTPLPLRGNGIPYRGINVLMLWGSALDNGFRSPSWLTFKQAMALGGRVRKGEKGSLVVYASSFSRSETDEATGEENERDIPFLKGFTVFNADQIDGLPDHYKAPAPQPSNGPEPIERAERFAADTGAVIRHGGNRAFYNIAADFVQMPPRQAFRDPESYYSTLAHELTHWTGHDSRLARTFGKRFGDKAYGFEELVAELGAAFLSATLDLTSEPRADHADYIGQWLDALKADKRAIFTAASSAQRAVDFLTITPESVAEK